MRNQNHCKFRMFPFIYPFSSIGSPVFERGNALVTIETKSHSCHLFRGKMHDRVNRTFLIVADKHILYTHRCPCPINMLFEKWTISHYISPGCVTVIILESYLRRNLCKYFPRDLNASINGCVSRVTSQSSVCTYNFRVCCTELANKLHNNTYFQTYLSIFTVWAIKTHAGFREDCKDKT